MVSSTPKARRYELVDGIDRFEEKDGRITYSIVTTGTRGRGGGSHTSPCVVLRGRWITLHPISKMGPDQAKLLAALLVMAAKDLEKKNEEEGGE